MSPVVSSDTMDACFVGKRAVITGGLGFIGSTLARRLVQMGSEVLLVDSLIPEYGGNLHNVADIRDRVEINISDVRDTHCLRHFLSGRDYLFNLAGQTSHLDSMSNPFADLDINSRAQLAILETCREHNSDIKVIFASTRQVYGRPDYLPVDEKHPIRPVDVNGINKVAGEWYHTLYNEVHGIPACVLRLTNTIGPRMRVKDARQTFLGIWVRHLVEGNPFEVWGGDQLRDFTFVDDAVDAFLACAADDRSRGRIYNLGGDAVISLHDLAELLVRVGGGGEFVTREFPEERKRIDIGDYYSDFSLIQSDLGWTPRVTLSEGLKQTVAFYRQELRHYL